MAYQTSRWLIGIDEAGRGPLAGPVAVGAVCVDAHNKQLTARLGELFPMVRDSKQLSPKKRDEWMELIELLADEGDLRYTHVLVSAKHIDTHGISASVKKGIRSVLVELLRDKEKIKTGSDPTFTLQQSRILLDGGLKAPAEFVDQETFIRGDAKHLPIALASIVAKTARDAHMVKQAKRFPGYGFEIHKGYGTRVHYDALEQLGPCEIHRRSFLGG